MNYITHHRFYNIYFTFVTSGYLYQVRSAAGLDSASHVNSILSPLSLVTFLPSSVKTGPTLTENPLNYRNRYYFAQDYKQLKHYNTFIIKVSTMQMQHIQYIQGVTKTAPMFPTTWGCFLGTHGTYNLYLAYDKPC